MQVVGGEVRAEVGAVAEDRAVLHQSVAEEERLAGADVVAGEDDPPVRGHDLCGDRRVGRVRAVPEETQDRHATQQNQRRDLHPGARE